MDVKGSGKPSNSQLNEWYVNKRLSSVEIAKIVTVWPSTVRYWLRKANIPIRSKNIVKPSRRQLERWYISEGKSSRKIAKIVGVGKSTILKWLKEADVSSRTHSDATLVMEKVFPQPSNCIGGMLKIKNLQSKFLKLQIWSKKQY